MSTSTQAPNRQAPVEVFPSAAVPAQTARRDLAHWVMFLAALAVLILTTSPLPIGF